ncbi:MAG: hypothetical protein LBR33_03575 [Propionibacteriaceae bacterium]|jgi:predicted transcriptional regulator|nr:hypothetical protein [Propionibacteriaceae bacterium]
MATASYRSDPEVDRALAYLQQRTGRSRSAITRDAILAAERTARRAALRAEAEALRDDVADAAEARRLAAEMAAVNAW